MITFYQFISPSMLFNNIKMTETNAAVNDDSFVNEVSHAS